MPASECSMSTSNTLTVVAVVAQSIPEDEEVVPNTHIRWIRLDGIHILSQERIEILFPQKPHTVFRFGGLHTLATDLISR